MIKENENQKSFLDDQLEKTKLAVEEKLKAAEKHLGKELYHCLLNEISVFRKKMDESNITHVNLYKNSLERAERYLASPGSKVLCAKICEIARTALEEGLSFNQKNLFGYIDFYWKRLKYWT
jgi:hypothetical protein